MRVIEQATAKDKDEILKLYRAQLGREFCPWNEYYPSMEEIDFDLSRDALFVMRQEGKIVAAISIDDDDIYSFTRSYNYAMAMTKREIQQAVEGMYHNLNSLQSRSGNQLPFTSINYGTCTLPEGRLIIKKLL